MNNLIPPIIIDKEKITRWHPEFDVESVADIIPSPLPKIEIDKPKIETAKDIISIRLDERNIFKFNLKKFYHCFRSISRIVCL